VPLPRS